MVSCSFVWLSCVILYLFLPFWCFEPPQYPPSFWSSTCLHFFIIELVDTVTSVMCTVHTLTNIKCWLHDWGTVNISTELPGLTLDKTSHKTAGNRTASYSCYVNVTHTTLGHYITTFSSTSRITGQHKQESLAFTSKLVSYNVYVHTTLNSHC